MTNHPNRGTKGPHCLCCARPIRKTTTNVYAPGPPGQPIANWKYTGNGIVVSQRYADVRLSGGEIEVMKDEEAPPTVTERRLWNVAVWDGETYAVCFEHFCSLRCAADFGRRAANAGYRITQSQKDQ